MNSADPIGRLVGVIRSMSERAFEANTHVLGTITSTSPVTVTLDTGQVVPNPFLVSTVTLSQRVLCVWVQGGSDVAVIGSA